MSICTIRNAHSNMMKFIDNKGKLPKYLSKNSYYPYKNYVKDYINKAVRQLIEKAKSLKVKKMVIGYNKGFKNKGIKNELSL